MALVLVVSLFISGGQEAKDGAKSPARDQSATARPSANQVAPLTVRAADPNRGDIDRRSYDVTKDLQGATGSIADVLRNVPSVQVDLQGGISIRGDASVTILVDGHPSALFQGPNRGDIIQQLPAAQYERVEVFTNPSAAFRPDGTGGIINLITKKAHIAGKSATLTVDVLPVFRPLIT